MKIVYANKKTERQCTDLREATKLFGGNKALALSLLARINALEQADVIMILGCLSLSDSIILKAIMTGISQLMLRPYAISGGS